MTDATRLELAEPLATWEDITPDRARELLDMNDDNRPLRRDAVFQYQRDIEAGRWLTTGDAIKIDFTGRLIDGQHRLSAIWQSGRTVRALIVSGLDPAAQRAIDVNIRRTAGDALHMLGITTEPLVVAAIGRLAIIRDRGMLTTYGGTKAYVSNEEIYRWVEEHLEAVDLAASARQFSKRLRVPASPIGYAMWKTSQISATDSLEFFQSVKEFTTSGEGDPRSALIRAYSNDGQRMSRRAGTVLGLAFAAWNAWRDNQKIKSLPLVDVKGSAMKIAEPV